MNGQLLQPPSSAVDNDDYDRSKMDDDRLMSELLLNRRWARPRGQATAAAFTTTSNSTEVACSSDDQRYYRRSTNDARDDGISASSLITMMRQYAASEIRSNADHQERERERESEREFISQINGGLPDKAFAHQAV